MADTELAMRTIVATSYMLVLMGGCIVGYTIRYLSEKINK